MEPELTLAEQIQQTAARILQDPIFAREIREAALRAGKSGAKSEDFKRYFAYFASTPDELASLGDVDGEGCTCNSNTWFTISSLVGPLYTCCATTTTTTTSGNFFSR